MADAPIEITAAISTGTIIEPDIIQLPMIPHYFRVVLLSIYTCTALVSAQDIIINKIDIPKSGSVVAGSYSPSSVTVSDPSLLVRAKLVECIALTAHS